MSQDIEIGKGISAKLEGYAPKSVPHSWDTISGSIAKQTVWYQLAAVKYAAVSFLMGCAVTWGIITYFSTDRPDPKEPTYREVISAVADPHEGSARNVEMHPKKRVQSEEPSLVDTKRNLMPPLTDPSKAMKTSTIQEVGAVAQEGAGEVNLIRSQEIVKEEGQQFKARESAQWIIKPKMIFERHDLAIPMIPGHISTVKLTKLKRPFTRVFIDVVYGFSTLDSRKFSNYQLGVGYELTRWKGLGFSAGIGYQNYRSETSELLPGNMTANSGSFISDIKVSLIDLPISVDYSLFNSRLDLGVTLHNSFTLREQFLSRQVSMDGTTLSLNRSNNRHSFYPASGLSISLNYPVKIFGGTVIALSPRYYKGIGRLSNGRLNDQVQLGIKVKI